MSLVGYEGPGPTGRPPDERALYCRDAEPTSHFVSGEWQRHASSPSTVCASRCWKLESLLCGKLEEAITAVPRCNRLRPTVSRRSVDSILLHPTSSSRRTVGSSCNASVIAVGRLWGQKLSLCTNFTMKSKRQQF